MNAIFNALNFRKQSNSKIIRFNSENGSFSSDEDESLIAVLKDLAQPKFIVGYSVLFLAGFGAFTMALKSFY